MVFTEKEIDFFWPTSPIQSNPFFPRITSKEVDFDGIIIPDHNPTMGSLKDRSSESNHYESKYGVENRTATAFAIGYMKALVERSEEEWTMKIYKKYEKKS